ncbi:hypothetical protein NUU61_008483 [Penicillium alfredii]|uniref:Uncharacterized protein n=1 Tax=Penicillium alfredii TaxID=1506179 RepID=A0A9W9ELI2_9EURO|nr:uncharacterized protein NUU61_008483 [Penicillium alfredii]KAJ5083904.1 hypothetical protein NUU61_008483 [Penicillium alfredii]
MPYTSERLELARQLFSNNGTTLKAVDDLTDSFYELRNREQNSPNSLASSWVDDDKDEDYEPPETPLKPKRKSPASSPGVPSPKRTKSLSPKSKASSDTTTDEGQMLLSSLPDSFETTLSIGDHDSRYHLRTRKRSGTEADKCTIKPAQDFLEIPDSEGEQPEAKACRGCQELQLDCSLETSPFDHACTNCKADLIDCEL